MKQTLWLPWPPTSNTMFGLHGHRRFVSRSYATWKDHAGEHLLVQKPWKMTCRVSIAIKLRNKRKIRWDLDNRIKPILDLLVTFNVIEDDSTEFVQRVSAEVGEEIGATVTLEEI
jgi:Holliday junction resolvase RusA-like endonuclease